MKNLRNSLAIVVLLAIASCGKSFHFTENTILSNGQPISPEITDVFKTDSSTQVFIRRLYIDSISDNYKEITLDSDSDNIKNKLIEVQYLIFNKNKVLYISTVPSKYIYDKTNQYLLKAPKGKIYYPNCFFLNSFYFGTINVDKEYNETDITIEFKRKKLVSRWNLSYGIRRKYKTLELSSIENFKINKDNNEVFESALITDNSVKNKIIFENIYKFNGSNKNYFHYLSFNVPYTKKESKLVEKLEDSLVNNDSLIKSNYFQKNKKNKEFVEKYESDYPAAKAIYIIYKDTSKTKIKELIIPFKTKLKNNDDAIRFKANRVKFITHLN